MNRFLLLAGILWASSSTAAPVLVIDSPTQDVAAGDTAFFTGSVTFDAFMPFGAEPALAPPVPAGFVFSPALALGGPFSPGDVYLGPLFVIQVPQDAASQVYSALATVGGVSNSVPITLTVHGVPEPGTFGLVAGAVVAVSVLRRAMSRHRLS